MKILYIEDNDDNVYVMRNRLGRAGFGSRRPDRDGKPLSGEVALGLGHADRKVLR